MEVTVSGKTVWLRDRIPAREGWPLRQLLARAATGERLSFEEDAQALAYVVESWEFEGDPSDPAVYGDLDMGDFIAIENAVGQHALRLFRISKN
mgnify:CR=1 FL=1|jgi:hypothetical protein